MASHRTPRVKLRKKVAPHRKAVGVPIRLEILQSAFGPLHRQKRRRTKGRPQGNNR